MRVTINKIEIEDSNIKAVVELEGLLQNWGRDSLDRRDIAQRAAEQVIEAVVQNYLAKNLDKIVALIDQKQIQNLITLKTAARFVDQGQSR